jgi:hypothetical protein
LASLASIVSPLQRIGGNSLPCAEQGIFRRDQEIYWREPEPACSAGLHRSTATRPRRFDIREAGRSGREERPAPTWLSFANWVCFAKDHVSRPTPRSVGGGTSAPCGPPHRRRRSARHDAISIVYRIFPMAVKSIEMRRPERCEPRAGSASSFARFGRAAATPDVHRPACRRGVRRRAAMPAAPSQPAAVDAAGNFLLGAISRPPRFLACQAQNTHQLSGCARGNCHVPSRTADRGRKRRTV